jgi:hypothetical protein
LGVKSIAKSFDNLVEIEEAHEKNKAELEAMRKDIGNKP